MAKEVLLVFIPRAAPEDFTRRMAERFPQIELRWVTSSRPDGSFVDVKGLPPDTWKDVTILCVYVPPPAEFVPGVKFVQLTSAGADLWPGHALYEDKDVIFSTSNGIHPPQIAEWVIGTWLSHTHQFQKYVEGMKTGYWEKPYESSVTDSVKARMGILGYGAIGRQTARLAQAMGMEVYAYTRSEKATPESRCDDSYCVPGTGDPKGEIPAKWFHGSSRAAIHDFLSQDLDIVVLCLPLTAENAGLLSHEEFDILSKKKTFVTNVARGGHINQEALIEALESGKIRGAALDVTNPEPLPADHPLWKAPNLFISPHVSWKSDNYWNRLLDILEINIANRVEGKPMINVVNKSHHY